MLLVLLAELRQQDSDSTDLWFSPQRANSRYGLSENTRGKGLREHVSMGPVDVRRASISPDAFDFRRLRNVYQFDLEHLKTEPANVPDPEEVEANTGRIPNARKLFRLARLN